ncbi:hypothetical protein BKA82DRAFT_4359528 [Pisolithus tinctorius]|nr:hypothetical protein BKA82DRAFT_4359528 [Pisolithus tinctorius]
MQARHYWGTHVASLGWGPLSLLLKGSWPAKLSIPSFVSAIHFDAVVVESRIVSLREPVQFLTRTSKIYFAEGVINYADRAQIWLERGDPQGHIKSITQLARRLKTCRIIAGTGAGVANATAGARFGWNA